MLGWIGVRSLKVCKYQGRHAGARPKEATQEPEALNFISIWSTQ